MAKGTKAFDKLYKHFRKNFFSIEYYTKVAGKTKKLWDHHFTGSKVVKDVTGKTDWKEYSAEYGQFKSSGAFTGQSDQFKKHRAPVLTGRLVNDFKIRGITKKGFSFGTVSEGGKVRNLNKQGSGRLISLKGAELPPNVMKMINSATKGMLKDLLGISTKNIIDIGD